MCTRSFIYILQRTIASKIRMSRLPKPYLRSRRRSPITLTMRSGFITVLFNFIFGHESTSHSSLMVRRDGPWFRCTTKFNGAWGQGRVRRSPWPDRFLVQEDTVSSITIFDIHPNGFCEIIFLMIPVLPMHVHDSVLSITAIVEGRYLYVSYWLGMQT